MNELIIEGVPVPKHYGLRGRFQRKDRGSDVYQEKVALLARAAGFKMLEGPLLLRIEIGYEWPKKYRRKRKPPGWAHKATKPDSKNLLASIEDALTGIAYKDDCQVAEIQVRKMFVPQGERARTLIVVRQLDRLDVVGIPDDLAMAD